MKIEKCFVLATPRDEVWDFITTPEKVATCIPGCQAVEETAPRKYKTAVKVQVGPIKTTFNLDFEPTEERPPEFAAYLTSGTEGGRASRVKSHSTLALKELDAGRTEVTYTSDIQIVGRFGKFGAGVMKKKADSMGEEFVAALRAQIETPAAVAQETAAGETPARPGSKVGLYAAIAAVIVLAAALILVF